MKKLIAFAISLTMIMSMFMVPVYADQQPSITNVVVYSNASNNQIVVKGTISTGNGKNVTIQVLDPNGYLDYLSQTTSTDGGNFNFTFKSNSGAKGTYTVKIGGEGILTPYEKTFEFSGSVVTPSEISNVTVKADKDTSQVILEGNISAGIGKNVTLQVLDPNGILDYIGQTISIEGGKFTFTFTTTKALKGNYTVKIGGEGISTPYEKNFGFSGEVVTSAEISNVTVNAVTTTSQITVDGNISTGSGKNVTIQVLNPNGDVEYIGQTTSTEGGKFTFTFTTNSVLKGSYTVKIGGEGVQTPYEKTFEFSGTVVIPAAISNVAIKADKATAAVTVEGNISTGSGKNVTIKVLDPNGDVEYIGQTISTEGGKFTFAFTSNSVLKGSYTVKIGGEGISTPYETRFEFPGDVVTPAEISNIVIKADKATAGVTAEGSISTGSGKNVTIKVLDPNGNIEYIGQTVSTDGGKFTFAFKTNAVVEGSYTVNLGGEGISIPYQKNFEFSGGSQNQKPSAPTDLKAVAGTKEIDLTWTAVTGAASYNVYRSTTTDGQYTKVNNSPVTTASYNDTGLSENTTYYYKITAVNSVGESDNSTSVNATTLSSTVPSTISNITVNAVAVTGQVTVSGNISTGSGKQVTIQALDPNGDVDYIGQVVSTEGGKFIFAFVASSIQSGTYTVKIGGSGILNPYVKTFEFSGGSQGQKPSAPVKLKAAAGTSQVSLTWTAVTGATSYNVYRSTTAEGEYTKINSFPVTTTSYSDTGLSANTAYFYKVTAVNAAGESDKSASIAATTEEIIVAPVVTKDDVAKYTKDGECVIPTIDTADGKGNILIKMDALKSLSDNKIKIVIDNVVFEVPANVVNTTEIDDSYMLEISKEIAKDVTTTSAFNLIGNAYEFVMNVVDSKGNVIRLIHDFDNNNKVSISITLRDSDLSGVVDKSKLEVCYFDTDKIWKPIGNGTLIGKDFTFYTPHFTQFAVMENKSTTPSNGGGSSSSGGSSSTTPTTPTSKRLAGLNRIETSIAIAKEQFSDKKPDAIVLTSGEDFPDALGGSGLAYKQNAPVLLVGKSMNDSRNVLDYINANLAKNKNIYVLGGTGAVSTEVSDYLTAQGYNVVRLGGIDRYETNQKIADTLNIAKGTPIVIANGNYFADALSISSIADMNGYPVLINGQDSLSANVIKDITNIQPTTVYVIGGTGVLSANIETQIKNLSGNTNIVRLGGKDRYETSLMIADKFNLNTNTITVASGENFPDALSGSVLAARKNSNVLLINNNDVSAQKELLKKQKITNIIVLGGEGVINNSTVNLLVQK